MSTPTFVVGISSQPFAFGAVRGADDVDCVSTLHRQVILAEFTGHHHLCLVQQLLITCYLKGKVWKSEKLRFTVITD